MADTLEPLVRDLVVWCAARPRTYAEVIEAWRTSCPRLTVWEEARARNLIETRPSADGLLVIVTREGQAMAARHPGTRPARPPAAARPNLR